MTKAIEKYIPPFLSKPDDLIIPFHNDRENEIEYYKTEINRLKGDKIELQSELRKVTDKISEYNSKIEEYEYLKKFRNMFKLYCFKRNSELTIIQCTNICRKEKCFCDNRATLIKELLEV